jgi:CheY-like chemotaxis protein
MKKRVLIVDDSATARAHIADTLVSEYDCLEAADGQQGYEIARSQSPVAMVVDLEMPVMDGLELLQRIKEDPVTRPIPVIIVTTSTEIERTNKCRTLGCAGFVLKPVDAQYLSVKLRRLLAPPVK